MKSNAPSVSPLLSLSTAEPAHFNASGSAARQTFRAILSELKAQPMKPLSLQRFSGNAARNLAQQIHSDTQRLA